MQRHRSQDVACASQKLRGIFAGGYRPAAHSTGMSPDDCKREHAARFQMCFPSITAHRGARIRCRRALRAREATFESRKWPHTTTGLVQSRGSRTFLNTTRGRRPRSDRESIARVDEVRIENTLRDGFTVSETRVTVQPTMSVRTLRPRGWMKAHAKALPCGNDASFSLAAVYLECAASNRAETPTRKARSAASHSNTYTQSLSASTHGYRQHRVSTPALNFLTEPHSRRRNHLITAPRSRAASVHGRRFRTRRTQTQRRYRTNKSEVEGRENEKERCATKGEQQTHSPRAPSERRFCAYIRSTSRGWHAEEQQPQRRLRLSQTRGQRRRFATVPCFLECNQESLLFQQDRKLG